MCIKNRPKGSLTSGKSIFNFCKTAGQSGFRFFESAKAAARYDWPICELSASEAGLDPQTALKSLRSASKPRFSWPKSRKYEFGLSAKPLPAEAKTRFRRSWLCLFFLARGSLYRS